MQDKLFDEGIVDLPAEGSAPSVPTFFGIGSGRSKIIGFESFTPSQLGLTPPKLQLIQRIDRADDVGRPGQWKLGREVLPEPLIVIIKSHSGRQFTQGEGRNSRITCASTDGHMPHPTIAHPRNQECGIPVGEDIRLTCPYSPWKVGPDGERIRPPCEEMYVFLIMLPELQNKPAWLICSKSATRPAKEFVRVYNQLLSESGGLHTCDRMIQLASEPQQKQRGGPTYYIPTFHILNDKPEPFESYVKIAKEVREADLVYLPRISGSLEDEDVPEASAARGVVDASYNESDIPF